MDELLIVNQVAGPLNRELLEDLSKAGVHCKLLTGTLDGDSEQADYDVRFVTALRKFPTFKRLFTWLAFTFQAIVEIIRHRSVPVLVVTNPPWPMLVMPALKRLFGVRYVLLIYDIYPDVMERMGKADRDSIICRIWRGLSRRSLCGADGVITLGKHMAETLTGHLKPGDECDIEIIPNWADTNTIRPLEKADNPFAKQHGLTDKFVILYSGAFGATHDMESIVTAAEKLGDLPEVHFLLIGGGTREQEVAQLVADKNLPNLTLLGFQPFDQLRFSLTAADCAIVSLDEGYEGLSVPSKSYYAMAAGLALLAFSNPGTELQELVAEHSCGVHILPGRSDLLAEAIRSYRDNKQLLDEHKRAARRAAETEFSRGTITARYMQFLKDKFGW